MDKQSLLAKLKTSEAFTPDERAYLVEILNTNKKYGLVWEDKPEDAEELLRTHLPVLSEVVERRITAPPQPSQETSPQPSPKGRERALDEKAASLQLSKSGTNGTQTIVFEDDTNSDNTQFENLQKGNLQTENLQNGKLQTENLQTEQSPLQPTLPPLWGGSGRGQIPNHILIEGDNLHALTALTFTHEGKIDVMYFDPPYNTGNKEDFIYNDEYVDKEDAFRHSKWLSFMYKRLQIAKRLLKDDGVIFCSIGDDEISQLTLLFNEVFSENNKLGIIARVAKTAGDMGNYFAPSKDYVIAFTKNKNILSNFKGTIDETLFKKVEIKGSRIGEKYRDDVAFYQASLKDLRPNQKYFVDCPDGTKVIPPCSVLDEVMRDGDGRWRWTKDTYLKDKHLLVFKKTKQSPLLDENGNQAIWNVYTKSYLNDREEKGTSPRDYLDEFINRKGADLIKQYDIEFSYSKPFELIQHLIKITNKPKDIVILDFFAGSGTTLHAVLNLNSSDKGNRKCIIATNNENSICDEVTYPRCQRIILPYKNLKGKEMPFYPNNNLRYYRTEFVGSERSLKNKRALVQAATQMLCVKEDIYTEINELVGTKINTDDYRCFSDDGRYLIVIYNEERIEDLVPQIANIDSRRKIKIYIFAPGQYPFTEEFEDVLPKIELCALPDAIYKAYNNVLPKKKKRIEVEDEELPTP